LSFDQSFILDLRREENRQAEIKDLTSRGIIPVNDELEKDPKKSLEARSTFLMGRVVAVINVRSFVLRFSELGFDRKMPTALGYTSCEGDS
jgi:hypothetical protein